MIYWARQKNVQICISISYDKYIHSMLFEPELCWWLFIEMVELEHTNLWYCKSIVTFNLLCHLFEKLKGPFASKFDYTNICMLWLHIAQQSQEH